MTIDGEDVIHEAVKGGTIKNTFGQGVVRLYDVARTYFSTKPQK